MKLSSYIKNASPSYAFRIEGEISKELVEKRLHDLKIGSLVETDGAMDITVGYPITGSELLGRLCALDDAHVVVREGDKTYSNRPLITEEPQQDVPETVQAEEKAPAAESRVFELRTINQEQISSLIETMKTQISESFVNELGSLRTEITAIRPDTSTVEQRMSALEGRLDSLQSMMESLGPKLDDMLGKLTENKNVVKEIMENYQSKLAEMATANTRANQRVHKEVKRDSNGFIIEVIESIIPPEA